MNDERTKKMILERRARFIAAAVASAGIGAATLGCGGSSTDTPEPQPCLSVVATEAGSDATPDGSDDGAPQPCLKVEIDAGGSEGSIQDSSGPEVCLTPMFDGPDV